MDSQYVQICSFGKLEFGYYEFPDGGSVNEYKVVALYWDRDICFLDEIILSYENTPGEAIELIAQYVKKGMVRDSWYGCFKFAGGFELKCSDGHYTPVLNDKEIRSSEN